MWQDVVNIQKNIYTYNNLYTMVVLGNNLITTYLIISISSR